MIPSPALVNLLLQKEMALTVQVQCLQHEVVAFFLHCPTLVPDPCLSGPCDPNANCEREGLLSGNFTCLCQAPFTVDDGFNCSSKVVCECVNIHVLTFMYGHH